MRCGISLGRLKINYFLYFDNVMQFNAFLDSVFGVYKSLNGIEIYGFSFKVAAGTD